MVHVNPSHVKKSNELDDNSLTKNDVKDALTIARLVKDGRYQEPIIPDGVYAELPNAMNQRQYLKEDLNRLENRVHNWLDCYFPEFLFHLVVNNTEFRLLHHHFKTRVVKPLKPLVAYSF